MKRVLIVDDEQDIRLLARFMLRPAGYEVLEAGSGEECLSMLAEDMPDLLLLDIRMPGIDGWDVLQTVKRDPQRKHIPIVMMSAHASGHTMSKAKDAGSDGYVVKPFKEKDLLSTVKRFADPDQPDE